MSHKQPLLARVMLLRPIIRDHYRNLVFWCAPIHWFFRGWISQNGRSAHVDDVFSNIKVVVINLESREDRLASITAELKRVGIDNFSVYPAVQGSARYREFPELSGKRGCADSHLDVLSEARETNQPVLVLEDDVQFMVRGDQLRSLVEKFLRDDRLDAFFLDWSSTRTIKISEDFKVVTDSVLASAYLLKQPAVSIVEKRFVTSSKQLARGKNFPIDHAWWFAQRYQLVCVAPNTQICKQTSGFSDIEKKYVRR